ncbi:ATP-binding cassette subfamily C protein LapB [Desulfoprunum benzoelyticum]|uniref:ATP-binding cassette subfamily C protein LapB n=1 Tax=Desulfoprunum benzoelyticum TaxID=1506996 RepID=A0A840UZY5_9BACT|nr:type I secretion system permease/ATPase [Desulfoprunum benzoelyticum]MBB5348208.1 ATP-binding cassette subfamily C protein LapB [Desulfoprunum benzoelyticum]
MTTSAPVRMTTKITSKIPETSKLKIDSDVIDDPLSDCLLMLARIHGRRISRATLRAGLPLTNNRLTVNLFARAATRAGLTSRVLKRPVAEMTNLELPCILLLHDNRALVLVTVRDDGMATVLLPETGMGQENIPVSELQARYSGYAIFCAPEFHRPETSVSEMAPRHRDWFWGTLFSSWRIYRDVLLASFLINLFALTTPFFILNVYDRVIPNYAFETLWVLSIGIGVVYLFSLLMRGLRGYFIDIAGKKANLEISALLFEKVLGLKMAARPESIGSFSNKIQQFDSVRDFITSLSLTALVDLPFAVLSLLAIWYLGGSVVIVHLVAIVVLLLYAYLVQMPLKRAVEQAFHASAQRNAVLVEGLNGLETLKMLGAEGKIQRTWEESVGHISRWGTRSRFLSSSVSHVSAFVQSATMVAVIIAGVYAIARGIMSQGGLIAVVMLTRQALAPMTQVVGLATRYHRARTALTTLQEIMAMPVERPLQKHFLHRGELRGAIEFKDVNFTYPGQSVPALTDLSLTIKAGERVGVIGAIGSGKTTLGKLLLGLYEPDTGMVAMDGTDIRQIDPTELRHFIGCVPQDITLFRGSVRDNIILGREDVGDAEILRVADLAGVSTFVKRHAMGFDMPVGEQGRLLSGGQRQAMAMARALLLDPPVLILDEPSSSMDARSESNLRQHLNTILKGKTLILTTHRASLLALVDRVIVLDNGMIRADGPKAAILEALKNGQINI